MRHPSMLKHFVDSSVAQPMLLGSKAYKKYLESQFVGEQVYISDYVQMEIKRSCIIPFINFYFLLDMPNIENLGDALAVWSNQFRGGDIKAVMRLVGALVATHQFSNTDPKDKPKILRGLGFLIKRIEGQLRRKFINIGENATRCTRAKVLLVPTQTDQSPVLDQFEQFVLKFNDTDDCRSKCTIDDFFLNRFSSEVEVFFQQAKNIDKPKSKENKGFMDITENLRRITKAEKDVCSCRMCGKIGDAVITLEVPENMQLEHTDYSFDNLCEAIGKSHRMHPSEKKIFGNHVASSSSKEN